MLAETQPMPVPSRRWKVRPKPNLRSTLTDNEVRGLVFRNADLFGLRFPEDMLWGPPLILQDVHLRPVISGRCYHSQGRVFKKMELELDISFQAVPMQRHELEGQLCYAGQCSVCGQVFTAHVVRGAKPLNTA